MTSAYDDMDLMKVEDFIGRIQHWKSYKRELDDKKEHCSDCIWIRSKLDVMYKKTEEYAKMRKTDDDKIEWNTLILEALDTPDEAQTIEGPSPAKKRKMVPHPKKMEKKAKKVVEEPKKANVLDTRIDRMMHELAEAAATAELYDLDCLETSGAETVIEETDVEKSEKG